MYCRRRQSRKASARGLPHPCFQVQLAEKEFDVERGAAGAGADVDGKPVEPNVGAG